MKRNGVQRAEKEQKHGCDWEISEENATKVGRQWMNQGNKGARKGLKNAIEQQGWKSVKNAEKIKPDDAWKGWKGIVKKSAEPESLKGRVETLWNVGKDWTACSNGGNN